ncbi:MAG: DUF1800 domain-containing protein [Polaromonas sp.]|nr:DUF1800 domain-containing protein [Polaromonas sp.]
MPNHRQVHIAQSRTATVATTTALMFCALLGSQAFAQTDIKSETSQAQTQQTQHAWRATSRLGYGPNAAIARAAQADPKRWALQQIDAAYLASQRAPNIPPVIARFNAPVNDIARDFQAEREARRTARLPVAAPDANYMAAAANNAADPNVFSREMQQTAAAWRVVACSDPSLENPLLARMTEFWFNHLNVFVGKGPVRPFVGHYAVNVIRANALGKFEDLLLASAQHPAMLLYLDQAQSNVRGLNENYARELMELHTLGVNSGYTQNDVHELARILTGWTVNLPKGEGFVFAPRLHDTGDKVLLGRTFRSDGMREGEDAIRMLAREPATAQRIAKRLAASFVADNPPQTLIDRLASTFTRTQGDIRAVMHALVESPEFWRADNTLFKTPIDFACSALTASGGAKERREIQLTLGFLAQAGQPVHGWQTPDGYSTSAATWLAPEALTRRADYAISLSARIDEPAWLEQFFSDATRQRIAQEAPAIRSGLMLASPDFMRK